MKKYKVLIVHNYYQISGGEDTVVKNEKKMLEKNGHKVVMYTRHNSDLKNLKKFDKIRLLFETIFSMRTYREVKKLIKEEGIDIVHVHNTLPLISPSVYYAAFFNRIPVIQTIHNFRLLCPGATLICNGKVCEQCINKGLYKSLKYKCYRNSLIQTFIIVLMLKIHRIMNTYNKVNGYITLTKFNKDKLSNLIKERKKIFIKPNFMFSKCNKFEKRCMKNYFVFLGRIDKLKGIDILVNAWVNINNYDLYIIGDGPDKKSVENMIINNNLSNVKLLGFMKRKQAFEVIKQSRSIIVPSQWYEGFPMTIVESLSLGVPIIASSIGNLKSIIKNGVNGILFNYKSKSDLVEKIKLLIEDKQLNDKLNEQAYRDYELNYSDKANYRILYNIYQTVINNYS